MGASLGAERHENVSNTVEHHASKLQKNKAGHASTNTLSHLVLSRSCRQGQSRKERIAERAAHPATWSPGPGV